MTPGTRLGAYEILSLLGAGGMGEVYRAKDSTLKREVALKVLPADVAKDRERLARFQREAEVLASLNHPHIAQIYGLEHAGDTLVLVMELVEGEELSQRIARGPIPLVEALPIARQIAEALEAAHEQGVVHRDLKPANIKVRPDGTVKVLDFGLAKAVDPVPSTVQAHHLAQSPTITSPAAMTAHGVILGTAAYMSPEQARGKAVDKRADTWAFGAVLFEMLTGTRAFEGADVSETLASILRSEPAWAQVPPLPAVLVSLLRRCLARDLGQRVSDMSTVRFVLAEIETSAPLTVTTTRASWTPWLVSALLLAMLLGAAGMLLRSRIGPPLAAGALRVSMALPDGVTLDSIAGSPVLSPDGARIILAATDDAGRSLWVRTLGSRAFTKIEGTKDAANPFWSPDGHEVGFFSEGRLKIVRLDGGTAQIRADAPNDRGAAWVGSDIVYVPRSLGPLAVVGSHDGAPRILEHTRALQPRFPEPLPDGNHFLFVSWASKDLYVGSVTSTDLRKVGPIPSRAIYSPQGYLLFDKEGTLLAQRFDVRTFALTGEPIRIEDRVASNASTFHARFSAADNGTIAYIDQEAGNLGQMTWYSRTGAPLGVVGAPDSIASFRLSHDQRRVAVDRADRQTGLRSIWLMDDIDTGVATRLFEANARLCCPTWSADGKILLVRDLRTGALSPRNFAGALSGSEIQMAPGLKDEPWTPTDWSRDGRYVVGDRTSADNGMDILLMPMGGAGPPKAFLSTSFNEGQARIAPNGKWVAYTSDESGTQDVYVQSFPLPGQKRRISSGGGAWPRWREDNRELFFFDGRIVSAVTVEAGEEFRSGSPKPLFRAAGTAPVRIGVVDPFDVSPKGDRFLMLLRPAVNSVSLLLNWPSLLPRD